MRSLMKPSPRGTPPAVTDRQMAAESVEELMVRLPKEKPRTQLPKEALWLQRA